MFWFASSNSGQWQLPELDFATSDCLEREKRLSKWLTLESGDVLIWDEVQGELTAVPDWISELSKHRHRGGDLILCSQKPERIPKYVRGLVGDHVHLLRKWGSDGS